MLRIEEIVGAMDDEFRYSLDALSDEKLAALAADKAALRRLRPVGVSNAEALAMITAIQDKRERARNAPPPKPKKPRAPRKARDKAATAEIEVEAEVEVEVPESPPIPRPVLPPPAKAACLPPPRAHGPAIRLGPPPQDGPVLITEPPPKPVPAPVPMVVESDPEPPPTAVKSGHAARNYLILLGLCLAAGAVIALL
ncbi:MAG: pathoproteinis-related protein 1-like [Rhodospirillaceae bacterium]|nr:MAG: pathoproteinis-related protein 1-like [Rhodospirillaceae bacterium]TNC94398.1 MAG: pathoproteinis-related protein 1-like protein [Stygiobacter sp.]